MFVITDRRRNDHSQFRGIKGVNGMVGPQGVGMDNPEYHMMNARAQQMYGGRRMLHPQQTVGVPVLDPGHHFNSYGGSSGHSSVSSNGHIQHLPQPHLQPEPAHEYYNELLPRAPHTLAPRSETTV